MDELNNGTPMEQELPAQETEMQPEPEMMQEPEAAEATEIAEELEPAEEVQETAAPKKKSSAGLLIALIAVVAAIVVLVVMLVTGKQNNEEPPIIPEEEQVEAAEDEAEDEAEEATEETIESAEESAEDLNAFVPTVSYIQPEEYFNAQNSSQVIASCGDNTLDNQKLAYYYWQEFHTAISQMGTYASYFVNQSARLDTQQFSEEESWDQWMMNKAAESYSICAAAAEKAKAVGFELPEEQKEVIAELKDNLELTAANYGFATGEELVQKLYGPYCTVESFLVFTEETRLGAAYLNHLVDIMEYTDDDLLKYYEENPDTFSSLEKDDTSMINVRHILLQPEAVELTEEDEGYEAAVQEAKDAAKAKAEEILAQWEAGDKTEEAFAALATEHTQDPGSAGTGGLYENVYPGQMVPAFNDWCFDEARKTGDTGIVETDYGYHIMFFVEETGESYWHLKVDAAYKNKCYLEFCEEVKAEYPTEIDLTKAAIFAVNVAS